MRQLLAVLAIAAVFVLGYVTGHEPTTPTAEAYQISVEEPTPAPVTWDYLHRVAQFHGYSGACYEDALQLQTWTDDGFGRTVCIPMDDVVAEVASTM